MDDRMFRSRSSNRSALLARLTALACVSMASGTCIVVEEGGPGMYDGPGVNDERMADQEEEVIEESDR